MELLSELLSMNEGKDFEQLLEDLGNLKKLGLGRMANAFKQTFRYYDDGRGRYNNSGMRTSDVGNKIQMRRIGVGPNSEFVDVKHPIKNWGTIKKAYRDNEEKKPSAIVIYVDQKAVALLVGNMESMAGQKGAWGVTYDFTGFLDEDEIKPIVASLDFNTDERGKAHQVQIGARYGIDGDEKDNPKGPARKIGVRQDYRGEAKIKNYEGFGVMHKNINLFIDGLVAEFGPRLRAKVIFADNSSLEKGDERAKNRPINREDIRLFKDDIKTRLTKFKLENAVTVNNVREFVNKVFDQSNTKKIKFAGETYETKPGSSRYGRSESGSIEAMMKGGIAYIQYFSSKKSNDDWEYDEKYITVGVKLVNMQLKPVEVKWREFTPDASGRMRPGPWKTESLE